MIIRGGENIYPREIEEFLYTHPDIVDAQVIGVPDAKYGEAGRGVGQAASRRRHSTSEDVRDFCRGKIAHFKVPRYVRVRRRVPDDGHRQGPEVPPARDGGGRVRWVVTSERAEEAFDDRAKRIRVLQHWQVGYSPE